MGMRMEVTVETMMGMKVMDETLIGIKVAVETIIGERWRWVAHNKLCQMLQILICVAYHFYINGNTGDLH